LPPPLPSSCLVTPPIQLQKPFFLPWLLLLYRDFTKALGWKKQKYFLFFVCENLYSDHENICTWMGPGINFKYKYKYLTIIAKRNCRHNFKWNDNFKAIFTFTEKPQKRIGYLALIINNVKGYRCESHMSLYNGVYVYVPFMEIYVCFQV